MILYRIVHTTHYHYTGPVLLARHILHLQPQALAWQKVIQHHLNIHPTPDRKKLGRDSFGNPILRIELDAAHSQLVIQSHLQLRLGQRPWPTDGEAWKDGGVDTATGRPSWNEVREGLCYRATALAAGQLPARQFLFESPYIRVKRELRDYAAPSFPPGRDLFEAVKSLNQRIHADFCYAPGTTRVGSSVLDILRERRGVCQDFAHLMIGCLRSLGLAARYVSGYLRTMPSPSLASEITDSSRSGDLCPEERGHSAPGGSESDHEFSLIGADASHAWVAVFFPLSIPTLGHSMVDTGKLGLKPEGDGLLSGHWVEFDPTNNCLAGDSHITLAWGRDFGDVSPVRGVIQGGGAHRLEVGVRVERVLC